MQSKFAGTDAVWLLPK